MENQQANAPYSHPLAAQPPQPPYAQSGQLPPGQLPLTAGYPVSPLHSGGSGTPLPPPYDQHRPAAGPPEDADFGRSRNNKYEATLSRHFEAWSYAEYMAKIGSASRTVFNFSDAYGKLAREEITAHPIPTRLPNERELGEMITNAEWIRGMLENVRGIVQQSIQNERAREGTRANPPYENEDAPMFEDGLKSSYSITEVRKRRGRAAPPGRCHSCNRIDTPEWRRGPDGARTLCNACGLHYAKLERKRQLEGRSIRPKPSD